MTNDDIITVRTFINANAPSIVRDTFEIICDNAIKALSQTDKQQLQRDIEASINLTKATLANLEHVLYKFHAKQ